MLVVDAPRVNSAIRLSAQWSNAPADALVSNLISFMLCKSLTVVESRAGAETETLHNANSRGMNNTLNAGPRFRHASASNLSLLPKEKPTIHNLL
jgi:hypothetical protein